MEARCERVRADEKDNEHSQKDRGKNKKFKNCPCISKTRDFRDWNESPDQAAKSLKDKHLKKNF